MIGACVADCEASAAEELDFEEVVVVARMRDVAVSASARCADSGETYAESLVGGVGPSLDADDAMRRKLGT